MLPVIISVAPVPVDQDGLELYAIKVRQTCLHSLNGFLSNGQLHGYTKPHEIDIIVSK